jgi:membrane-bound lytic murein transglycosylase D
MKISFILILIGMIAALSPATTGAQTLANQISSQPSVPSQLKPPTEDIAQLDELIDEAAEEKPYHIPMILNDSVENHLEYFKTRGRDVFQRWLDRSARYIPAMKDIFREKNLPEDLVYVAMIESGFNPYAVSWAKAVGPWQFMPATGKLYGLKIDWWIDERKDPIKSTMAAAEHLKDLHNLFGSWPLALASYNAGAGKVQRAVLRTRSDDFWDLKASRYIRKETKNYVPKYMAATIIAKNPEAYGFSINSVEPFKFDEVMVDQSTDLRLIARCANCSYEEIKELNPEIKRWVTPPQYANYVLRIPIGKKDTFLANYAAIPAEQKIKWERHLVQKGETLAVLSRKYNTTPEALRDINRIKKDRVIPGKHILIPLDLNSKTQDLSYLAINQGGKLQDILYRVRRGETLGVIARNHNVTVSDIREWNKGLGKSVRAGQKIKLIVETDQI